MDKKILGISAVLLFVTVFLISYVTTPVNSQSVATTKKTQSSVTASINNEEDNDPKTEECPLNGAMYSKKAKTEWETRRPMAVMIENHQEARPQSGISSADVVYEAVAEGGITRTMSLFYCKLPSLVGPVRSARMHFMKMLKEYGQFPLYVHVGGANCNKETGSGCANGAKADALGTINKWGWGGYNDLNQFSVPYPIFYRDYERLPNVATEHTMYSDPKKLLKYAAEKRKLTNVDEDGIKWYEKSKTTPAFAQWKFADDAKEKGTIAKVYYPFWNQFQNDYSVTWDYDATTNSYKRTNGQASHIDKNTGKQLETKNVVLLFAKESPANDNYEGGHILYDYSTSGDAIIFQNGNKIEGKWTKGADESRTKFTDKTGKEISFVRGQIWISILPVGNSSQVKTE